VKGRGTGGNNRDMSRESGQARIAVTGRGTDAYNRDRSRDRQI